MSAIDRAVEHYQYASLVIQADRDAARSELQRLRAAASEADALRATVAEQARQIETARDAIDAVSDAAYRCQDWSGTRLGHALDKCDAWLAANAQTPAPEAEQERTP